MFTFVHAHKNRMFAIQRILFLSKSRYSSKNLLNIFYSLLISPTMQDPHAENPTQTQIEQEDKARRRTRAEKEDDDPGAGFAAQ